MRHLIIKFQIVVAVFLVVSWQHAAAHSRPHGIEVSVDLPSQTVAPSEEILVRFTYKNVTQEPIRFLKWGTPFEGRLNEDLLAILFEGAELPYDGWHIKRAPATEADYMVIAAGQSKRVTVNLLTAYNIDLQGEYHITVRDSGQTKQTDAALKPLPLTLKLTADRDVSLKRTPTVSSCPNGVAGLPNNRFPLIDRAVGDAEGIALVARNALRDTPVARRAEAARYREWFGVYVASRWDKVQSNFDNIYLAARNQVLTFVCEDNQSFFAAVFPSQPYTIYLGRAFWSAPRLGTDSKAGTVIHELSHFFILAGTLDHVYGQSGARALAINDPNRAFNNADSHEYFAENTPFLSMPAGGINPGPEPDPEPEPEPDPVNMVPILDLLLKG
ncbi:MAG: M35 family metallo-endopeptidase [Pseudomonadota bacterium]